VTVGGGDDLSDEDENSGWFLGRGSERQTENARRERDQCECRETRDTGGIFLGKFDENGAGPAAEAPTWTAFDPVEASTIGARGADGVGSLRAGLSPRSLSLDPRGGGALGSMATSDTGAWKT